MPEKKKFYGSFHDLSPREYMYIPKGTLEVGKPGSFSRVELCHLLIAIAVLTVAFTCTFSKTNLLFFLLKGSVSISSFLYFMPIAFIGIVSAFFVHELSHKFMAQKYRLWSEFRMYPRGLVVSLFLAFLTGLVFAAPGAVMFRGDARSKEYGRIAAAGPGANIVIAVVTYVLYYFVFYDIAFWGLLVGFICLVNLLLATFNLIPLDPLDGRKVFVTSELLWFVLFSTSVLLLGGLFVSGNLLSQFFV
ncbi:MAG: hypothetical protein JXA00_03565 [Candidatus Thermoplasmatota archaeon]|nr:hypothetical protein [Candidatus Thermoplasmatota archaeon]